MNAKQPVNPSEIIARRRYGGFLFQVANLRNNIEDRAGPTPDLFEKCAKALRPQFTVLARGQFIVQIEPGFAISSTHIFRRITEKNAQFFFKFGTGQSDAVSRTINEELVRHL